MEILKALSDIIHVTISIVSDTLKSFYKYFSNTYKEQLNKHIIQINV